MTLSLHSPSTRHISAYRNMKGNQIVSGNRVLKNGATGVLRIANRQLLRVFPDASSKLPWERSLLEDLAARRPWNARFKLERALALPRIDRLRPGVTVVIVNWNTKDVTADVLRAVQDLSPHGTEILVIDNGSTDGSRELFAQWPGIRTILFRSNMGHGAALDIGLCRVRTSIALTLDSDAIPIRKGWLEPAVAPVRNRQAILAGQRSSRDFVHPVYSAVDTAEFLRRRLSYQIFVPPEVDPNTAEWGKNAWDTGELMTGRLGPGEVAFVEGGPVPISNLRGGMTSDIVYHYGGVSRESTGWVSSDAVHAWRSACSAVVEYFRQ